MNKITPITGNITEGRTIQRIINPPSVKPEQTQVSFKAVNPKVLLSSAPDNRLELFSRYYGKAADFLVEKTGNLMQESKFLEKNARFIVDNGKLAVKGKSVPRSLVENLVFPFFTLPRYAANWVLKKAQSVPFLKNGAKKLYNSAFLRNPRKANQLNECTNQLEGILFKTQSIVEKSIKDQNLNMNTDDFIKAVMRPDKAGIKPENIEKIQNADKSIREALYKVSNKFFDKHTGNFNTAFERPLNRIVTGLIPVAFLANDAYNLAILCGDSKEDSKKEADARRKQEITRVMITAYIQLLTFGAFTKQVNTIPWFTPLTSAATVLFSEITSRKRLGKPIFFLSKDKAKEYNEKEAKKSKSKSADSKTKDTGVKTPEKPQLIQNTITFKTDEPKVFANFKAAAQTDNKKDTSKPKEKEAEKSKEKKALMNMDTFKKALAILITGSFVLSFLKNSSYTKNSKIVQSFKKFGDLCKKKIYDPLAYKTFEIKPSEFDDLMKALDDVGCKEIADGHRFIRDQYSVVGKSINESSGIMSKFKQLFGTKAKNVSNSANVIMMQKHSLSSEGVKKAVEEISASLKDIPRQDLEKITDSVKTAIKLEGGAISEQKYEQVAKKAVEIIKNKKDSISEEQVNSLTSIIKEAIQKNASEGMVKVETKLKPFVDIVTEPFKFIKAALNLPFKCIKLLTNFLVSPIKKKAGEAALGKAELNKFEKIVNKAVTEIFGEESAKTKKISQEIFANAMEQLQKQTAPYRKAKEALERAQKSGTVDAKTQEAFDKAKDELYKYVNRAVQKSFDGVTQSSNKNTDLAMATKLASSAVTSAFLVADNYNMVMIKSNGEDTEGAKEKASERIIQRLSALFYQSLLINWFNSTFRSTYNSSLKGMASVAIPNTLTTEILTRKSIGMPVGRKSIEELNEIYEKNENRTGLAGKYFKFMRLLTGKKPLKDRLPKDSSSSNTSVPAKVNTALVNTSSTNLLEIFANK